MLSKRHYTIISCILAALLIPMQTYGLYLSHRWENSNLISSVNDALVIQLDDKVNDVTSNYEYLDIVEARIFQFHPNSLQFDLKLYKPVPLRPIDDVTFLWTIDTDQSVATGQRYDQVGSEFNIRIVFRNGRWYGYVENVLAARSFSVPIMVDNDVISASVNLVLINNSKLFNFRVFTIAGKIVDKSDRPASARVRSSIQTASIVSEVSLRPAHVVLKDGITKAWVSVIPRDGEGKKVNRINSIKFFLSDIDIAEIKENGLIVANPGKVGSTWLTAKVNGVLSSNIVTVTVGEVNVIPPILLLSITGNRTGTLKCEVKDAYGSQIIPKTLSFYTSNTNVVNVANNGTVIAIRPPKEFWETPYVYCSANGLASSNAAVVRVTQNNLGITMEPFKGKYVTFYVPREPIQGFDYRKIFREYDILRMTDIAYELMRSIFDYYPFNGGTQYLVNDPGFRSDNTVPCGLSGNPIRLGTEVDKPEHNSCMIVAWDSGYPQWFVYFHEMGHNFFLNAGYKVTQFLPGLPTDWVYSEALATALGMYVAMTMKEHSLDYKIPEKILSNILSGTWRFGLTPDLDLYLSRGANYEEITPNILDEMIDITCSNYGYKILYRFFSLFTDRDKPFSFMIRSKSDQATFFVAALSAAVGHDLRYQYRMWGFPINDSFYESIIDEITTIINQRHLVENTPKIIHNYDWAWHNKDFSIILLASDDRGKISEIFYRVNNGPILKVGTDGLPKISEESSNNTLEFWSVDSEGNEETPHNYLFGIKLDKTAPRIEFVKQEPSGDIDPYQRVKIIAKVSDSLSGVRDVILSYQLASKSEWRNISMKYDESKKLYEYEIEEQQKITTVRYKIIAYDNAGNAAVDDSPHYVYNVKPRFRELVIEAPKLALIGNPVEVKVILKTIPPYHLPVNISVIGCGTHHDDWEVISNTTFYLKNDNVCTMIITAKFMEHVNESLIRWEKLILTFDKSLGRYKGAYIVPNGELKPVALFSNGSIAHANITVDGKTTLSFTKTGGYELKVKAELWGVRNETTIIVYVVPSDVYLEAQRILGELGSPFSLNREIEEAIVSGDWGAVASFVKLYDITSRSSYDPLSYIAYLCARKWAIEGGRLYLDISLFLTVFRSIIYLAIAIVIGSVFLFNIFRLKASSKTHRAPSLVALF